MRLNQNFILIILGICSLLYFKPSNKLLVILLILTLFYLHTNNISLLEGFKPKDSLMQIEEEKRIDNLKNIFKDDKICNLAKELGWKYTWPKSTKEEITFMQKNKDKYKKFKIEFDNVIRKFPDESRVMFEEAYAAGELEMLCPDLFKSEKQIMEEYEEEQKRKKRKEKEKGNVKVLASDTISCKEEKPFPQTCYFKIVSRKNDKALEVGEKIGESKNKVYMWELNNNEKQMWYSDKSGRIKSVYNNMCLQIDNDNPTNSKEGNRVIVSRCVGFPSQRFLFNDKDNGRIKLEDKKLFLEIRNDSNDDGAQIVLGKFNKETGDNQRWYIKSKGMPKISKLLVDSHNSLDNKFIENIKIEPSNNYTYHFWMYIEDRSYRKNLDKHILHKGPVDSSLRSPGIWITSEKDGRKFKYTASTNEDNNEFQKSKASAPVQQWIHVAYVLDDKKILFYLNGDLDSKLNLDGMSNNNEYDLYITYNKKGFEGELKNLKYHNYSLSADEIRREMMLTHPDPIEFGNVIITKIKSNYTPETHLDIPDKARLNNMSGWRPSIPFGAKPEIIRDDMYLETRFDQYYQLEEILTQGHGSEEAWITKFKIDYYDFYDERMKSYNNGQVLSGNTNNMEIKYNQLDILTNKIRIYPVDWYKLEDKISIGLRVGFKGTKMSPNKCSRKIGICECDALVEREHKDYKKILDELNRCKNSKYKADIKYNVLKERVKSLEESMMQKPQTVYLNQIKEAKETKVDKKSKKEIEDHIEELCNHLILVGGDEYDTMNKCKVSLYKNLIK